MTNQEIGKLKAGPEINKLVFEQFFDKPVEWLCLPLHPKNYSLWIEDTFLLIAELNQRGFKVHISIDQDGDCESVSIEAGDSNCSHKKNYDPADGHGYTNVDYSPIQPIKPPLAICHAALKLVEKLKEPTEAK